MSVPLAQRLRSATHDLHRQVERAGVMPALLRGRLPRAGYLALLRNLHAIYQPLEEGLARHAGHAALAPLLHPSLARVVALTHDLDILHGPGWAQLPLQPAAQAYAARLRAVAVDQPALLAAHAYVRYLGDLSGGQMLARIVAQGLQLPAGQGVAFYDFGSADQVAQVAAAFRHGLDHIAADELSAQALVDEACSAFARHRDLFEQLEQPVQPLPLH